MHVDREVLSQVEQLLQSFVDEDDADEGGEGLFCKSGEVADQSTGIRGHQDDTKEGRPQTDAGPQRQVRHAVVTGSDNRQGWVVSFLKL